MKLHISLLSQKKKNWTLYQTKRSQSVHNNKTWWYRAYSDGYMLDDWRLCSIPDRE